MTKQKRMVVYLIGIVFVMGIAMLVASAHSTTVTASDRANVVTLLTSQPASNSFKLQCGAKIPGGLAQCGSQASSCKNCHEVKGEDTVNAKGDWHIAHAFGDFCEFCHGGNVQATDEAAAHQGLVAPLDDVKANCSSCHAADYPTKAEPYAKALGVTIGIGGSPQAPTGSSTPSTPVPQQPAQQPASAQPSPAQPVAATPTSNQVVDYVAQYQAEHPKPLSAGTLITGLLLGLTVVGGGSFVAWNEKRLRLMPRRSASAATVTATDERTQELAQILPMLEKMDAQTLRALRTILSNRR